MGISFFEKMHGELLDRAGQSHHVDFDIKVEASHAIQLLDDGTTRISGVVSAPPWATAAALDGTLEISLLEKRQIQYTFSFVGDDEELYRFEGKKKIKWHRPITSFTNLNARLLRGDDIVGAGRLTFELTDIPSLVGSLWPTTSFSSARMSKPLPEGDLPLGGGLSSEERELIATFAEALLVPGRHVPAPDERTAHDTLAMVHNFPPTMLRGFRAALHWLDAEAVAFRGKRYARLSLEDRRAILAKMTDRGPVGPLGRLAQRMYLMISAPIKMVHFDRQQYLKSLGQPEGPEIVSDEPPPRYLENVVSAEEIDSETEVHAETVIVGSGAGGAALAKALAERGQAVAIVEEGRFHGRKDFTGSPLERMQKLWRDGGSTFSVGRPPLSVPLGLGVGGTTTINSGTCYRPADHVLEEWLARGFPEDFSPKRMARYYDNVAVQLQVTRNEMKWVGKIGEIVARGANAMGLEHGPLPRNAPDCDAQGVCIFGCPTGAKRSTDISYMPKALRAGAQLHVGLPVKRILMHKDRAVAVEARGPDATGVAKRLRIYADRVVLACGSIYTPVLLRENGFRLPHIGRNLSVHPGFGMAALFEETLAPWNAIPQGYGVSGYESDGICFEGYYVPPQLFPTMIPYAGERLTYWMDRFDRIGQFGFMVRDTNTGSVRRDHTGRPVIIYSLADATVDRLKKGAAILAELLLRAGAKEILPVMGQEESIRTIEAARALDTASNTATATDFSLLGSHPLATCRMGPSKETAVVDFEHRVYGTENLYIADGSVVPSSLGVNPQMTIMAFATRLGEILAAQT